MRYRRGFALIGGLGVVLATLTGCANATNQSTGSEPTNTTNRTTVNTATAATGATTPGAANNTTTGRNNPAPIANDGPRGLTQASYTKAQVDMLFQSAKQAKVDNPCLPSQIADGDSVESISGNAGTLTITFKYMNLNESDKPLTGGGVVEMGEHIALSTGVAAQWGTVSNRAGSQTFLQFKSGNTYLSIMGLPRNTLTQNQIKQIAASTAPFAIATK